MRAAVLPALLLVALALAGCTGGDGPLETVSLGLGDVPRDDSASRSLACGLGAELSVVISDEDGGRLTVVVEDGSGAPVYNGDFFPGDEDAQASLGGASGPWTLTVHRSLELDTPFAVELAC